MQPLSNTDQRLLKESRLHSLKPIAHVSITKRAEATGSLGKHQNKSQINSEVPNQAKTVTPSQFSEGAAVDDGQLRPSDRLLQVNDRDDR